MAGVVPQRPSATSTAGDAASPVPANFPTSSGNSFRVAALAARLSMCMAGHRTDPTDFVHLCFALARGIDYAVANNEVPVRAQELALVLKQVYQRKSVLIFQAVIMVLMISVKNACKSGWFLGKDTEDLLTLANEIGSSFCSLGDANIEQSYALSIISKVISRFYPRMKMGYILASLEIKPGYGAFLTDFQIPKNKVLTSMEKVRLFVAQTDNIETSSCIITPPQMNFLLNGKGVEKRTNVSMDKGPQFPTNVTSMLKYGTNLLQVIGHSNGNYIIAIAFMSVALSSEAPVLQDYAQPVVAALDSDSEIIEGPSRISLNCPISHKRIRTPVKGHLCKHHQCFDYDNFMEINSRRPSWRCPHCNQSVCYTDICIDQNMVKVLREVAEGVSDVIISADGSWKAALESDEHTHQLHSGTIRCQKEGFEHHDSAKFSNTPANVVDLTMGDDENFTVIDCETEDRKPFQDSFQGYSVATNLTVLPEVNSTPEVVQNAEIEDNFWEGIFVSPSRASFGTESSSTRLDAHMVGGFSESTLTSFMPSPVLTDAVSPALNREPIDGYGATQPTTSVPQSQFSDPYSLQLQPSQFGNSIISIETGRPSIPRHVSRTPIAIQALPAQTQAPNSHQRLQTNLNTLMPNGVPPAVSQSPVDANVFNSVGGDTERHQQFSRSLMNPLPASGVGSSMQHHSMIQNRDHQDRPYFTTQSLQQVVSLPATSHVAGLAGAYRSSSQTQPPRLVRPSSRFLQMQVQQGAQGGVGQASGSATNQHARFRAAAQRTGQMARPPPAVPVLLHASVTGSLPMMADGLRESMGEQRGNMGGIMQPDLRADGLLDLSLGQNWRPTGRMRGSLAGQAHSAALSQLIIRPTQPAQAPGPPLDQTSAPAGPSQLHVLAANSNNAHGTYPTAEAASSPGGLGMLPGRSTGMR